MNDILKAFALLIITAIAFAIFFGYPIMYLWNSCLVGSIDGVNRISFLQALGITVLVALLMYKPDRRSNND